MNLTQKEKKLITILGGVIILAILYFVVYSPLQKKATGLQQEVNSMQNQVTNLMTNLKPKAFYEDEKEKLKVDISLLDKKLPQEVSQELVIQTFDKTIEDLKLALQTFGFSNIEVFDLQTSTVPAEGTTAEAAPEATQAPTGAETPATEVASANKGLKAPVTVSGTASYGQLKQFFDAIKNWPVTAGVEQISISTGEEGLTINMAMNLYGLSVKDREVAPLGLKAYQKGNPTFFDVKTTEIAVEREKYEDLFMVIDPIQSDNAAVTIGAMVDPERNSYLYEETNEVVEATVNITKNAGKYYASYQLAGKTYPENGTGHLLAPEKGIGVVVYSSLRTGIEDKNGVKLRVNNRTDKTVYIDIRNEDSARPRLQVANTSGDVKIQK